jgi:uncharacterized protein (DUF1800 family)
VVPQPVRAQVSTVADDLLATSKANRDLLVGLVRAEVERSVTRLGLASSEELAEAQRRARALERRVEELERAQAAGTAKKSAARASTAKKSTAKKSTGKQGSS